MQLDELVFAVDSTQLEKANKLMQELGISIQALDKKVVDSAKKQAQAEALQAKAAKDSASARLTNAKATEAEAKAADTAAKASERKAAAAEKATKTSEVQAEASSRAAKMLQKQVDVTEYLIDGYSRGEAKQLAQMKSYGALADEMQKFISLKELERKLVSDPFDKSASGMSNMLKQYRELTVAVKEFQSGNDLTKTQARDLAKDRERIVASMRAEGATIREIQAALKLYGEEYNKVAEKVNTLAAAEVKSLNAKKEIASATRQVTQEDERMAASLAAVNSNLNKGATDLLVKYESNLKKMGLAQDEVTKKLATYKGQLAQVQAQEEKRKADNLARSLSPQLTDIGVSLYSGQAPLTVLLQQGGQIADLFRLSGVEAQNFGKAMKDAFTSMIPVMATVVKGMGQLVTSLLADAGKGVLNFAGNLTGMSSVLENGRYQLTLAAMAGETWAKVLLKITSALGKFSVASTAAGLAILAAGAVAAAVAMVQAIKKSDDLAKAMFNTDAAFKATHSEVLNLSVAMAETTGKSAGKFAEILGQMAKQGGLAATDIQIFGKVAVEQMSYLGMSAEEVVKQYSEMTKKPVEGMQKLAESTGLVSVATLQYIRDLVKLGDEQKAQEVAIKELARVQGEQVEQMKDNLSGFAKAVKAIGSSLSTFFNQVFDMMWKAADPTKKLEDNLAGLRVEFDKVSKMGDSQFQGNRTQYLKDLGNQIGAGQTELGLLVARNSKLKEEREVRSELAKANAEAAEVTKEYGTQVEKARDKERAATASVTKAQKAYNDAKAANILNADEEKVVLANLEKLKLGEANARHKVAEAIETEAKKKNRLSAGARQTIQDQERLTDIQNKAIGLNKDYNNSVDSLNRLLKSGHINQQEYNDAMVDLEAQQPRATEAVKADAAAIKLRNSLLGESEGLGKAYLNQLAEIDRLSANQKQGKGRLSAEEIAQMYAALEKTTPVFKKQEKALEEYNKRMNTLRTEFSNLVIVMESLRLASEKIAQENMLSQMSPEMAKAMRIELEASNKSKEEQLRLEKELIALAKQSKEIAVDKTLSDEQKRELMLQNETNAIQAQNNSLVAQKNIILEKNQAYQVGVDSLMGSTTDVLGRLNQLAQASGNISFANAVSSIDGLLGTFDKINAKQLMFNKLREGAKGDTKELAKINEKEAQAQLGSYADITKGLKGFFKEGSKGYKTLNTAEKAFRTYEAAMAIKNSILKMAAESNVLALREAADKKSVASAIWASTKIVAEKMKEGLANAYAAITNQGSGDPYTAFARIAAMAAIMAGLGFAVAGGGGGRSTGGDGKMTYATGKGTVLGDSDAVSESIANSLSILEDVDTLTMQYSYEMLKSLRSIEATMTGVTNIILRSNGISETAAGITEGTVMSQFGKSISDFWNPIPIFSKILTSLFGTKTTITGQGVYMRDANYDQIRSGDVEAGYYTDVNKKKKFFGITTSDKNSTNYQQSDELSQQFAKILNGFVDVIKNAGEVLGVTGDEIDLKLKDFVLKIGKIDLKGLKGDEIKEKLLSVFGAAGDDIARQALEGFERFQQAGEGYLETIVRVATTVETVRASMDSMNRSMLISVDNAMALAEALGGVDKYSEATTAYIRAFYSESEQNEIMQRQLTEALAKQNIALPKSKEEYRKLLEAQDLSTESGREMYALLLLLAPAFAQVADAADKATQDMIARVKEITDTRYDLDTRLLRAQGKEQEAVNRERQKELDALNALDPTLGKVQQEIWATEDAAKAAADATAAKTKADQEAANAATAAEAARKEAINSAYSVLQKAIQAEKDLLQARVTTATETITTITALFNLLEESVKKLYNEVDSTAKMNYTSARALVSSAAIKVAAGGSIDNIPGLTTAIEDVMSGLSPDNYSSTIEYDRERLRLAGDLSALKNTSKKELTAAEQTLAALNDQIAKLDETLKYWEMQVQIAQGTYVAVMGVSDAIRNLQNALTAPAGGSSGGSGIAGGITEVIGGSNGGTSNNIGPGRNSNGWAKEVVLPTGGSYWVQTSDKDSQYLDDLYEKAFKPYAGSGDIVGYLNAVKAAGGTLYNAATLGGWSYRDMLAAADRAGIPRFEEGGAYAGGLALVGEDGPELINFNRGGHVSNNASTSAMLSNSAQRIELLESALRSMSAQLTNIASNTKKSADILRNVTPNGDSMSITPSEDT